MFCSECGEIVDKKCKNCPNCGSILTTGNSKALKSYDKYNQKLVKKQLKRLEKEKKKEERDIKKSLIKALKTTGIAFGILFIAIILSLVGLFYYFNQYAFNNTFTYISMDDYIQNEGLEVVSYKNYESINISLDEKAFNSMLLENREVIQQFLPYNYQLLDMHANLETGVIKANGRIGYTLFPVSLNFDIDIQDENFVIFIEDIKVGVKDSILPELLLNPLLNNMEKTINIPLDSINIFPQYINIKDVYKLNKKIIFNTSINIDKISELVQYYITDYDPFILQDYINSSLQGKVLISRLINGNYTTVDLISLIDDIFNEQKLINDLLIVLDNKTISKIYEQYGEFLYSNIDEIISIKNDLTLKKKIEIANILLMQLDNYLNSNDIYYISDYGKIYDIENKKYITVNLIKNNYVMPNDAFISELNKCSFYYNIDEIKVKYVLNESQVLVVGKDSYEVMLKEEAEKKYPEVDPNFQIESPSRDSEISSNIKQSIVTYTGINTEVFFRYLKTDNNYAFAIASLQNDYQSIHSYVLQVIDGQWKVLSVDESYEQINVNLPDFNVKLLPPFNYEDINIKEISDYGKEAIIDQLRYKGYKFSGKIILCSYINDYVYVNFSSGDEFVILVNKGKLTDALRRDDAENQWDLPSLLMRIK